MMIIKHWRNLESLRHQRGDSYYLAFYYVFTRKSHPTLLLSNHLRMYTSSTLDLCNQSVQIWQYFQIICSESSNGKGILRYFTLIKWCCMHCYFLSGIFCREGMLECLNMDKSPQCSECPHQCPMFGGKYYIYIYIYIYYFKKSTFQTLTYISAHFAVETLRWICSKSEFTFSIFITEPSASIPKSSKTKTNPYWLHSLVGWSYF